MSDMTHLKFGPRASFVPLPRHRHAENFSDSDVLGDLPRSATRSLQPLHQIRDFDLMLDANSGRTPALSD